MSYTETFVSIADDCPAKAGECPPAKSEKLSKAALEYQLLSSQPYVWTHETLNYAVHRRQKEQTGDAPLTEELFFSERASMPARLGPYKAIRMGGSL